MHCDELLFSEDEDAENYGEQIRTIQASVTKDPLNSLNDDLFHRMLSDKKKPTPDILVSLHSQNIDPYAEIDEIESNVPKYRWKSPQKGFHFFRTNHSSASKMTAASPLSNAQSTPMSTARRQRLLEKLTPVLKPLSEDEDEYVPLSAKRRKVDESSDEGSRTRTPRVLRPRKSEWVEEDLIPLSALRESILRQKKESEQKATEERRADRTPRRTPRASTAIFITPKSSLQRRRSGGQRKLFVKKSSAERVKQQKRKTSFASDSSDDELLISVAKRMKKTPQVEKNRSCIDSDSDDDLPLLPKKPLLSSKL